MNTNIDSLLYVLGFVALVLVGAFAPWWRKQTVPTSVSDEELLAIFPKGVSFSVYGFAEELEKKKGVHFPSSFVSERLEKLVKEGLLKKETVPVKFFRAESFDDDEFIPCTVMYSR